MKLCAIILALLSQFPDLPAQQIKVPAVKVSKNYVEFMVLPALIYNSAALGYSWSRSERAENVLGISGFITIVEQPWMRSLAARYNYNLNIGGYRRVTTYLPLWVATRYFDMPNGQGEEDTYPFKVLNYSLGTGYGMRIHFKNGHCIRVESGIGASLYMIRDFYSVQGGRDFVIAPRNPVLPAFRLCIRYMLPL